MEEEREKFHTIYEEIAQSVGTEAAVEIYRLFRGQQISFPLKLYDPDKIREQIRMQYNGKNIRELAREYEYSEKTIRRIVNEKRV